MNNVYPCASYKRLLNLRNFDSNVQMRSEGLEIIQSQHGTGPQDTMPEHGWKAIIPVFF